MKQHFSRLRAALVPALAALAVAASAAPARATFVIGGNTMPQSGMSGGGVGGTVNFAVFQSNGSATDPFGIGDTSGAFLSSFTGSSTVAAGTYLYLYETSNTGTLNGAFPISSNTIAVGASAIIPGGYGSFNGYGFSVPVVGTAAAMGDPSSESTTTTAAPSVVATSGLTNPSLIFVAGNGSGITDSLAASYALGGGALTAGQSGSIFGFFSNQAPSQIAARTSMQDGGTNASGLVVTAGPAVPEPSSILLLSLALPLGLLFRRRLNRA